MRGNGQNSLPAFSLRHVPKADARTPVSVAKTTVDEYNEVYTRDDSSYKPDEIAHRGELTTTGSMIAPVPNGMAKDMSRPISNGITSPGAPSVTAPSTRPMPTLARQPEAEYISPLMPSATDKEVYRPAAPPEAPEVAYPQLPAPGADRPPYTTDPGQQPDMNGGGIFGPGAPAPGTEMAPMEPPPDAAPGPNGMPPIPGMPAPETAAPNGMPGVGPNGGYQPAGQPGAQQPAPNGQMVQWPAEQTALEQAQRRRKMMIYAGVGVGVAAGLGGLIWYLSTRKKDNK